MSAGATMAGLAAKLAPVVEAGGGHVSAGWCRQLATALHDLADEAERLSPRGIAMVLRGLAEMFGGCALTGAILTAEDAVLARTVLLRLARMRGDA